MRFIRIRIKNFKSIENLELKDIEDALILVGKNNTGKTSVMDAVRTMTGARRARPEDFDETYKNIEIEVELELTAEDLAAFGGILTENTLLSREMLDKTAAAEYDRGIWPEDTLDSLAYGLGWDNVQWYPFSQSDIVALTKGR